MVKEIGFKAKNEGLELLSRMLVAHIMHVKVFKG